MGDMRSVPAARACFLRDEWIDDAKKRHDEMEEQIRFALESFEAATGLCVEQIRIVRVRGREIGVAQTIVIESDVRLPQ